MRMDYILHLVQIIGPWGYVALFFTIFLESFPLTFFFPGDSLLFTTGFLASQHYFNIFLLIVVYFTASVFGYIFSYFTGHKIREIVLSDKHFWWIKPRHIEETQVFYEKYGPKTIIIGRFIPIVRSFAPALAGAAEMKYKKFLHYTWIGGILWTGGLTALGFYLGKVFPKAHIYLTPIIVAVIIVSILPAFWEYVRKHKKK